MTVGEATDELADVPTERLEAQITELAGHLAAAECRWLELVGEFDRRKGYEAWGCVSCAYWLSWQCGLDLRSARDKVRVARALEGLPLIRSSSSRSGRISYSKVRAIARVATPATEADLVMLAEHSTGAQLDRIVARVPAGHRSRSRSDAACATGTRVRRRCSSGMTTAPGVLTVRFAPEDAEVVKKAWKAAREELSHRRRFRGTAGARARWRRGRWWRWPSRTWRMVRRRARTGIWR